MLKSPFGFKNMYWHLSLYIICFSNLTVFMEFRFMEIIRFSEEIFSPDKYQCVF